MFIKAQRTNWKTIQN